MKQLHKHLHLQHRQHTGRVLHHKHTSYRGLAVIIGLAGAVMISLSVMAHATADTITIYAKRSAGIPTVAAVILSPTNGIFISDPNVAVSGTCEAMAQPVLIAITDNGTVVGSVACASDGTFFLPILVTPGQHTLVAKTYNITDDSGPDSNPVTFTYVAPTVAPTGGAPSDNLLNTTTPLVVTIDEPFITFGPGKDAIWLGTITGGTLPYQVPIDWGDGTRHDYKITNSGKQQFVHHYRSMQPHTITLRVYDASGRRTVHQYVAVTPYVAPTPFGSTQQPWGGSTPLTLYGVYLLLLVIFGGLWARAHPMVYAKVPVRNNRRAVAKRKHKPTTR